MMIEKTIIVQTKRKKNERKVQDADTLILAHRGNA